MLHRHLTEALRAAAAVNPVVTLLGPRQSGKTTLVRALFTDHRYLSRDATGHEIDVLIDTGGRLVPVEVKSGQTVAADAVDALVWWTSIPSNPNRGGVLVHGGAESFDFKGFRVLPWFLH